MSSKTYHYTHGLYNIWIARILNDDPQSQSGPEYGIARRWWGAKSCEKSINQEAEPLIGDGVQMGNESALSDIPLNLSFAVITPAVKAELYGIPCWETPRGVFTGYSDKAVPQAVGVWVVSKKTGTNGKHHVRFFPNVKFATLTENQGESYQENTVAGSAAMTKSTFLTYKDGELVQSRLSEYEYFEDSAELFVQTDFTPPTLKAGFTGLTSVGLNAEMVVLLNEKLDPITVNHETVILKKNNVAVLHEVRLIKTGVDAYKSIGVKGKSALTASANDYKIHLTTTICDEAGNAIATEIEVPVTTAAS